jgi:hypothetical protein
MMVPADGLLGAATAAGPVPLTDRSGGAASLPALAAGGVGTWAPTTGTLTLKLDGGAGGLRAGLDYAFTFVLANPARGQAACSLSILPSFSCCNTYTNSYPLPLPTVQYDASVFKRLRHTYTCLTLSHARAHSLQRHAFCQEAILSFCVRVAPWDGRKRILLYISSLYCAVDDSDIYIFTHARGTHARTHNTHTHHTHTHTHTHTH